MATALAAASLASPTAESDLPARVRFEEVSRKLGISFEHRNSPTSSKYLPETMGAGVALLDYDNDGRLDIFFTNGARLFDPMPASTLPDKSDPGFWNRLYHQERDGTFTDVTEKAGVSGNYTAGYSMGVAVGDYDNDGFEDILVTGYEGNVLYRNNGDGTFTDVTAKAGVRSSGWSVSAGFFDYNNDGRLDIFITRYLDWSFEKNIYCGDRVPGYRAYCHPKNFAPVSNILYRNNGDGTFTDVSKQSGIAAVPGKSLGVAFADYDLDGRTDIYVANDSMPGFLFHNNGDGTFSEVGLTSGAALNQDGNTYAGMGVDFADYDNDGLPDIAVTDLSNERYVLFRNAGKGNFDDESASSGVARLTMLFSGWGIKFLDYDNDGQKDIFAAQGHVLDNVAKTSSNLSYEQPPLLLRNRGGRFEQVDAGEPFRIPRAGRGAAIGDLDNDGDLDIVVANVGERCSVLRNEGGNRNHWLGLILRGTKSNRDGIGARIAIESAGGSRQYYTVSTAGSYISASDRRVVAGLGGDAFAKRVEIHWPSGVTQTLTDVRAGRMIEVREP